MKTNKVVVAVTNRCYSNTDATNVVYAREGRQMLFSTEWLHKGLLLTKQTEQSDKV